ncbi:MAG: hypothetical protein Q7T07_06335 [Burkholderiaceae bacterium]|nr:hypothetical protein [Burkholderiaceae bacterium]
MTFKNSILALNAVAQKWEVTLYSRMCERAGVLNLGIEGIMVASAAGSAWRWWCLNFLTPSNSQALMKPYRKGER